VPVVAGQAHLIAVVDIREGVEQRNVLHGLRQSLKQLSVALQKLR
jgi:hypothetical protein